jgi:nitrogen fixation protein FixH
MKSASVAAPDTAGKLTGWHVLLIFVLFFGIMLSVNVYMVVQAIRTFPGEVSSQPYEAGLAYNHHLKDMATERALGWRAKVQDLAPTAAGTRIAVQWMDAAGKPLSDVKVVGDIVRPATEKQSHSLVFAEVSPGLYQTTVKAPPGAWDLSVTATDGRGEHRTAERRVVWK